MRETKNEVLEETDNNVPENNVLKEIGNELPRETGNELPREKRGSDVTPQEHPSKRKFPLALFLILIIVGAAGYIGYDKFEENAAEKELALAEKELELLQQGARYGAESVLLEIFNEAITCNTLPINNGSLEINLIATECLSAPLSE